MVDYLLLEDQRKVALQNGDCIRYYQLCNQLGVEPEVLDIYERGSLDEAMENRRKRIVPYQTFYEKGKKLSSDFESDTKQKKENLRDFFTGKKRSGLEFMDALTIGAIHKKILTYAETRIQKIN